jgi:lipopolysaccharide biosynthesis glycosyltransferase
MIHLLYCGNEKAFDGILISLLSIIKYTKTPISAHILTMNLRDIDLSHAPISSSQTSYLDSILKEINVDSNVESIDVTTFFKEELLTSVNLKTFYTPFCLIRLFADKLTSLPDIILYLDIDTMAHNDISSIFDINMKGYELAAVRDYLGKIFIYPRYMNSGVILLNLPEIRKTKLFEKARTRCVTKKMVFPDQDALNHYLKKRFFIPSKYNSQRRLHSDTVIQHFCKSIRFFPFFHTLNVKPWEIDRVHKKLKIYDYDDILTNYSRRKELYAHTTHTF